LTAVTTGMIGGGFYNRHSAPQARALAHVLPWLVEAATAMDLAPVPDAITLADFGCSEGRNSIAVMKTVLPVLRSRTERPLMTVHSDLSTNDFSELLQNLRPQEGSAFGDRVYSAVMGGSMFDQLLPPRSTHIAMTFNAIGFLSRRPLARLPGYGPPAASPAAVPASFPQIDLGDPSCACSIDAFLAVKQGPRPGFKAIHWRVTQ